MSSDPYTVSAEWHNARYEPPPFDGTMGMRVPILLKRNGRVKPGFYLWYIQDGHRVERFEERCGKGVVSASPDFWAYPPQPLREAGKTAAGIRHA